MSSDAAQSCAETAVGVLRTVDGKPAVGDPNAADMLDISPLSSRVLVAFSGANVQVVIAPVIPGVWQAARALEAAGAEVSADVVRSWITPVLGPIFGRSSGGYRLARADDMVCHVDWLSPGLKTSVIDLSTFIKEQLLGLRWSGQDWEPVGDDPFVGLAAHAQSASAGRTRKTGRTPGNSK